MAATTADQTRRRGRPLTPASTAADANLALLAARATAAVVMDGDDPVGVITLADLARMPGDHLEAELLVGDLMTHLCVQIDPTATPEQTLRLYRDAAWDALLRGRPGRGAAHPGTD